MADALDPAHPVRRVVPLRGDVLGRRLAADLWTSKPLQAHAGLDVSVHVDRHEDVREWSRGRA